MDFILGHIIEPSLAWSQFGLLALLGGLASYFYPASTEPRFSFWMFISKLVAAFFVGKVFGEFIPPDNTFKAGWTMVAGFFAYPILAVMESRVRSFVDKFLPPGGP